MSYGTVQAEKMTTESGYSLGAGNASSFKNRLINGAMVIDQRNAGAVIAYPADQYTLDRWFSRQDGGGVASLQQSSVAPAGFTKSILLTVTTSDSSVTGVDRYFITQAIEGFNCSDLAWGTASAQTVTLSFWVRSSVTGTYGGAIQNGGGNRSYAFTYTITAANTWEQKTVTIAGDTTGTWATDNSAGMQIRFGLGVGPTLTTAAGSWTAGNFISANGATNWISTNGATFYLTGVQLEVGTVATSFDFRSIGTELALCQRYYVDLANNGGATQNSYRAIGFCATYTTTQGSYVAQVPVPMRTLPSLTQAGTMYLQNLGTTSVSSFAGPYSMAGTIIEGDFTMVGAVTANITAILRWNNSSTQRFAYSAEL
jgi:hypothetical protein